jgi:hypothetical protein
VITLQYVSRFLLISGGICGFWGASKMANVYSATVHSGLDFFRVLLNAIFSYKEAKATVRLSEIGDEDKIATLRGLGLVYIGFFLQAAGGILDIFTFRSLG